MLPHHVHICDRCGNEEVYHVYDHKEEEGDTVEAFCPDCDSNGPHTIGRYFA